MNREQEKINRKDNKSSIDGANTGLSFSKLSLPGTSFFFAGTGSTSGGDASSQQTADFSDF